MTSLVEPRPIPPVLRRVLLTGLSRPDADEVCEWLDETPDPEVVMVAVISAALTLSHDAIEPTDAEPPLVPPLLALMVND